MEFEGTSHHEEINLDNGDLIICQLAEDLMHYENHYNVLQNKYKKISLTWVVGTFIGMGYILSGYEAGISISIYLSIMFICFISSMGIFLLWHLDAGIYHRILESIFDGLFKLEKKYPKILGSTHQNIMTLHFMNIEPYGIHGMFYSGFILFLLTISATCLSLYLYDFNFWYFVIVLSFVLIGWLTFFLQSRKALLTHHSNDQTDRLDK